MRRTRPPSTRPPWRPGLAGGIKAILLASALAIALPGAGAATLQADLAAWPKLDREARLGLVHGWIDKTATSLRELAATADAHTTVYQVQIRTNVALDDALDRRDAIAIAKLARLYAMPLSLLQELPDGRRRFLTWPDANGRHNSLGAAQFLYIVAHLVRRGQELGADEGRPAIDALARQYGPVLRDHLLRWITGRPGLFTVRGWGCDPRSFDHASFIRAKLEGRLDGGRSGAPAYCNGLLDRDLWIILATAEYLAARKAGADLPPPGGPAPEARLHDHVKAGVRFIMSRLEPTVLTGPDGETLHGLVIDSASWRDHPGRRHSGHEGSLFPEDNAAAPMRDPSFETLAGDWRIEGTGTAGLVDAPVLAGRHALEARLAEGQTLQLAQAIPLDGEGRLRAFLHLAGDSDARIDATLILDGAGGRETTPLVPEPGPYGAWRRLAAGTMAGPDARFARLRIELAGPGRAVLDEARIVPLDAPAAAPPLAVVPPAPATGAWDVSHARRLVQIVRTLGDLDLVPPPLTARGIEAAFARQIAYGVFNGSLAEPRFANYLDGTDGWYRVNYLKRIGFGYAPGQLSATVIDGGYCRWARAEARLAGICRALWARMQADVTIAPAFRTCHMAAFAAVPCRRLEERALALVSSLGLLAAPTSPGAH